MVSFWLTSTCLKTSINSHEWLTDESVVSLASSPFSQHVFLGQGHQEGGPQKHGESYQNPPRGALRGLGVGGRAADGAGK